MTRKTRASNTFISLTALRLIVIALSSLLALAVIELVSYFGPDKPFVLLISGVLIVAAGLIASEMVVIWARKNNQRDIRIAESLFRNGRGYETLINAVSDIVVLVRPDGSLEAFNDRLPEITKYSASRLANLNFFDLVHPAEEPLLREAFQECLDGSEKEITRKLTAKTPAGEELLLEALMLPYFGPEGEPAGCELILTDYTEKQEIKERLDETSRLWSEIIERTSDGVIIIQEDILAFANEAFAEMMGLSREEVEGSEFLDFVHRDCLEFTEDYYRRRMKDEDVPKVYESCLVDSEGNPVPVELNADVIELTGEKYDFVLVRDMTQEKRRERDIRELQKLYRLISQQSPVGLLIMDNEGSAVAVNDAFVEDWNLGDQATVLAHMNVFSPQGMTEFEMLGFDRAYEGETVDWETREFLVAPEEEGGRRKISSMLFPVEIDGDVSYVVMISRDVTREERVEEELQVRGEREKLFFKYANDAIFITGGDGRIMEANPRAEVMTDMSEEEMKGISFHDFFDIEEREVSLRQLGYLKEKGRVHYESHIVTGSGKRIAVEISASLIELKDRELVVNIVRDITQRKRLFRKLTEARKAESLGVLAGGIAHDFNNILEGIMGSAELAEEASGEDDEIGEYIQLIEDSARRGAQLIRHLLNYARQSDLEFEMLDLNRAVRQAEDFARRVFDRKIHIRTDMEMDLWPISGDMGHLRQAIINLATNSRDAMPDGGEILLRTRNFTADESFAREHPGLSPGPHVELLVQDTGRGIPEEIRPRIFDPLFTTKDREEGTGLGLSIVHSTVDSHDGAVEIRSEPKMGTKVYIYIPAISVEKEESFGDLSPLESSAGSGRTVMIVDDEEIIRSVLSSILEQQGFHTIVAANGREAMDILSEGVIVDAILLDMIMPGMSGWQTYERLCETYPEIPVVVITGYADADQTQAMLADGVAGYIEKPFKASQIVGKLRRIFTSGEERGRV